MGMVAVQDSNPLSSLEPRIAASPCRSDSEPVCAVVRAPGCRWQSSSQVSSGSSPNATVRTGTFRSR
jgi:hypothetical protein